MCETLQAEGSELWSCQHESEPPPDSQGWCYVDPDRGVGAPELVAECDNDQRRRFIFRGDSPRVGEYAVLACASPSAPGPNESTAPAALGEPCLPADESRVDFHGFEASEVTVETGSELCASQICVVNHFRGRVSCPYGQDGAHVESRCFAAHSNIAITVPVVPQLVERQAADVVTCSCRCDGPGPGPFCKCPSDMTCARLISPLGLPGEDALVGSYCVKSGTEYDPGSVSTDLCTYGAWNCGDPRPY